VQAAGSSQTSNQGTENPAVSKKRHSLSIIDLCVAAAALRLCDKLLGYLHLAPRAAENGLPVFLVIVGAIVLYLLAAGAGFALSACIRGLLTNNIQKNAIGKSLGVALSLGFATAIIFTTALIDTPPSGAATAPPPTAPNSAETGFTEAAVRQAAEKQDNSILVTTSSQNANDAKDDDITIDEVGRWASYFSEQGERIARKSCVDKGGGAFCDQLVSHETHEVIVIDGRKVAVIRLTLHSGSPITAHTVRVVALKGNALVSVVCVRMGDKPLEPTMTPCANEIRRSLGITFNY
jgi:hypothetical protein